MNKLTQLFILLLILPGAATACIVSENNYILIKDVEGLFLEEEEYFKQAYKIQSISELQINSGILMKERNDNLSIITVTVDIPEKYRGWDLHLILHSNVYISSNNNFDHKSLFQNIAKFSLNKNVKTLTTRIRALSNKFTVYTLLIDTNNPASKVALKPFHGWGFSCGANVFVQTQEEIDALYKKQKERIKYELGENI